MTQSRTINPPTHPQTPVLAALARDTLGTRCDALGSCAQNRPAGVRHQLQIGAYSTWSDVWPVPEWRIASRRDALEQRMSGVVPNMTRAATLAGSCCVSGGADSTTVFRPFVATCRWCRESSPCCEGVANTIEVLPRTPSHRRPLFHQSPQPSARASTGSRSLHP